MCSCFPPTTRRLESCCSKRWRAESRALPPRSGASWTSSRTGRPDFLFLTATATSSSRRLSRCLATVRCGANLETRPSALSARNSTGTPSCRGSRVSTACLSRERTAVETHLQTVLRAGAGGALVRYDAEDDAYFEEEEPEPQASKPAPVPAYAAVGLLTGAVVLLLFIAIAGSSALVVTPFVMAAGGAAGAGAAGVACGLAGRRIRITPGQQAVLLVVVFLLSAAASGGAKYTYGGTGAATIGLDFVPGHLTKGVPSVITGNVTITNTGPLTIRLNPQFQIALLDPAGIRALRFAQGCPIALPSPPAEAHLVE